MMGGLPAGIGAAQRKRLIPIEDLTYKAHVSASLSNGKHVSDWRRMRLKGKQENIVVVVSEDAFLEQCKPIVSHV